MIVSPPFRAASSFPSAVYYFRLLMPDGQVIGAGDTGQDDMIITNVQLFETGASSTDLIDGTGTATASHYFLNDSRFAPSFAFDRGGGDNLQSWVSRNIATHGGYPIHLTYQFNSAAPFFRKMIVLCSSGAYPGVPISDNLVAPKSFKVQVSVGGFDVDSFDLATFTDQVWTDGIAKTFTW